MRLALQVMNRLAVNRGRLRILELLYVLLRELGPVHLDRQLVKLGGQRKRRLVALANAC
jgi:hypothetical protein